MKKVYIKTFGCQMNQHDSRRMEAVLNKIGYQSTETPDQAQLALINTCSVRQGPENKAHSLLGRLSRLKDKKKELIIGVGGCVAQQEGEKILKRHRNVDLVFGTDNIFRLPEMLRTVNEGKRALFIEWTPGIKKVGEFIPEEELDTSKAKGRRALIAISKGCDNGCSFCIVPAARGKLVCREKESVIREAEHLIEQGAVEIMLLGQNVNAYQARGVDFYQLLEATADLKGLSRLRFTSPHPNGWNNRLTDLMARHPVICNHIHLPFQSGADRILSLMKRRHTAQEYLNKIDHIKNKIPDAAISADIIVGFPGETEEEFWETLKIMETVRFTMIYAFKYSDRPKTKASLMEDDVPKAVKEERLKRVLDLHGSIQNQLLDSLLGTTQETLIDSAHPKEKNAMNGRNQGNISISVVDGDLKAGDLVRVKIIGRKKHSLIGKLESERLQIPDASPSRDHKKHLPAEVVIRKEN